MEQPEKFWALKAQELSNCPYFIKGDSLQVQMPGVIGNQLQMCSMPIATFIPIAMEAVETEGAMEAGYKNCACRWSYCQMSKISKPAIDFEEVLTAENEMSKPFLDQMPTHVAQAFRERATPMRFQSGDVVLAANVTSSHFHVIVKGMVRIANRGNEGHILELSVLRKGDCFGEMSILTGAATSNQVDAVEECLTLAVSKEKFHKLVADFPVLSILLYRMLSKRIKANNQKLAQLMSPGLSGELRVFPFVELVQTILTARMTGVLVVDLAQRHARFGFQEGRLLHASMGNIQATEVVDDVLRWQTGAFHFHGDELLPETNLDGETLAILLESLRRMDESTMMEKSSLLP